MRLYVSRVRARRTKAEGRPRPRPIRADSDAIASLMDQLESLRSERDELMAQVAHIRADVDGHRRVVCMSLQSLSDGVIGNMQATTEQIRNHVAEVSGRMLEAIQAARPSVHSMLEPGPN